MRYIVSSRALSLFLVVLACTSFHAVLSAPVHNGKPVIAVIPAAWHSPIHYQLYTTALRSAGYASVSERLPSCDSPDPKSQTVATDAAFIRERLLLPAINRGREIVVIMHSYSGGPGSMAAKGLSVAERRAAGQPGGIVGLIFLSAFVAHDGQTLVSGSGGQLSPWVNQKPNGQMGVINPKEVFYNDVPDAVANQAIGNLRDQATSTAFTPCGPPAWADTYYNGRRAYAHTTLDNAIPIVAQDAMLEGSGVQWDTQTFNTGHCPFLSQPNQLSVWTDRQITKFKAVKGSGQIAVA